MLVLFGGPSLFAAPSARYSPPVTQAQTPPNQPGNASLAGRPTGSPPSDVGLVRLAAAFYGVVTVFALGYAFFDRIQRGSGAIEGEVFLGLGLPTLGGLLSGIAVGLVIVGVVHVGLRVLPPVETAARIFADILGPITWRQALLLALFSAMGEELLFRGALWPHLGWIGTSFLFGLVHILPRKQLWGYPLFALLAGVLFAILREATGSVFAPILAHFTVNALNLWWLGKHHGRLTGAGSSPSEPAESVAPGTASPAVSSGSSTADV
jgi:membrane protease YdiL (CAAX protease family)